MKQDGTIPKSIGLGIPKWSEFTSSYFAREQIAQARTPYGIQRMDQPWNTILRLLRSSLRIRTVYLKAQT
jgi:hypothetical protein